MGWNAVPLEQCPSSGTASLCGSLDDIFHRYSAQRYSAATHHHAEEHGIQVVFLILDRRGLLPVHLLRKSYSRTVIPVWVHELLLTMMQLTATDWFQSIKGVSATISGVMNLPLIMAQVIAALLAGGLITLTGYYTPFMIISCILVSVGTGLTTN